ncbi:hypothetical protein Pelo_15488 [Pelomyxa schiedti]|nr:hypothetical protein Pelo_15488 [Pelomyxa schiedti]
MGDPDIDTSTTPVPSSETETEPERYVRTPAIVAEPSSTPPPSSSCVGSLSAAEAGVSGLAGGPIGPEAKRGAEHVVQLLQKLPLRQMERLKIGLLWGMSLATYDFEKYMVYYLIARSSSGGDCAFLNMYSNLLLATNILLVGVSLICGWFSDATATKQHRVLQFCSLSNLLLLLGEILSSVFYFQVGIWVCFLIRQVFIFQIMTSVWKVLKIRLTISNSHTPHSLDAENTVSNSCGNTGDITCVSTNIFALGVVTVLPLGFKGSLFVLCGWGTAVATTLWILSMTISSRDIQEIEKITAGGDPAAKPATQSCKSAKTCLFDVLRGLKTRFLYLWNTPHVTHILIHGIITWAVYLLVTYPVTIFEAVARTTSEEAPTLENQCNQLLPQLSLQGLIINMCYLITAYLYRIFIVDCPPYRYFKFLFPFLAIVNSVLIGLLLLHIDTVVIQMCVITGAQVIPYYLQSYDFYVLNTAATEEFLAFVLSVCWFFQQLSNVGMTLILSLGFSLWVTVILCLGLIIFALLEGAIWMPPLFKGNWAPVAPANTAN